MPFAGVGVFATSLVTGIWLRERQPGIDYSSLNQLAGALGLRL
jgi:hypothetical protein